MSQPTPPRLDPLDEAEWPTTLDAVQASLGTVLNVHRVMANHPDLMAAWTPLRQHIALHGTLSPRHRELVILRLGHRTAVDYEWRHHVVRAMQAGVSPAEVEMVRSGPDAGWADDKDALLLTVTDELFDELAVSDLSWSALTESFTIPQVLDLVVTVGMYTTLAMFINTTGVQIEDWLGRPS